MQSLVLCLGAVSVCTSAHTHTFLYNNTFAHISPGRHVLLQMTEKFPLIGDLVGICVDRSKRRLSLVLEFYKVLVVHLHQILPHLSVSSTLLGDVAGPG